MTTQASQIKRKVKIDSSLLPTLDILSGEKKDDIVKAIASLENFSAEWENKTEVRKLGKIAELTTSANEEFYAIFIPHNYCIVFSVDRHGEIEAIDLFDRHRLELFAKK
ncbi:MULTISPECIES: hypothetical protein [Spirulina sp. CCY15215]|uniref:hypothetical protein n=1 Tax=Spirulina sp. CCY15215 TaxID=2767591 RepID=UPI00195236DD|nr:hypothetical protein [Spirulina major]